MDGEYYGKGEGCLFLVSGDWDGACGHDVYDFRYVLPEGDEMRRDARFMAREWDGMEWNGLIDSVL